MSWPKHKNMFCLKLLSIFFQFNREVNLRSTKNLIAGEKIWKCLVVVWNFLIALIKIFIKIMFVSTVSVNWNRYFKSSWTIQFDVRPTHHPYLVDSALDCLATLEPHHPRHPRNLNCYCFVLDFGSIYKWHYISSGV